jgi:transcriptional regulator with XRE-family HTH domain
MEPVNYLATRIRELRTTWNSGEGLSQDALARELKVAPNTISRWETGVYVPSWTDVEKIARFFGVPMNTFHPPDTVEGESETWVSLLRTAKQLHPDDLEELKKYAEFRQARRRFDEKTQRKQKSGRRGKKHR